MVDLQKINFERYDTYEAEFDFIGQICKVFVDVAHHTLGGEQYSMVCGNASFENPRVEFMGNGRVKTTTSIRRFGYMAKGHLTFTTVDLKQMVLDILADKVTEPSKEGEVNES